MNWHIWVRFPGGQWFKRASYVRRQDAEDDYARIDVLGLAAKALGSDDFDPRIGRVTSSGTAGEGGGG